MWRSHLTVAFRALASGPLYASVLIGGLAMAVGAALLILAFIRHELSYDRWISNFDRIARLQARISPPGREPFEVAGSPGPMLGALRNDYPREIESGTRLIPGSTTLRFDHQVRAQRVVFFDREIFNVLELPLAAGDRATALSDPSALLLTETMARSMFGTVDPIGRSVEMQNASVSRSMRVVAVLRDLPTTTHLKLDVLAPYAPAWFAHIPWVETSWNSAGLFTYVKLSPGAKVEAINPTLAEFERRNIPDSDGAPAGMRASDVVDSKLSARRHPSEVGRDWRNENAG